MIISYENSEARKIFEDGKSKKLPSHLLRRTIMLLDIMDNIESLEELRNKSFPPDVRLHVLKGNLKGRYAIDINKIEGWRITFKFKNKEFACVAVENYHRG